MYNSCNTGAYLSTDIFQWNRWMSICFFAVLVILLIGVIHFCYAQGSGVGSMKGQVTDAATGEGLPGVNIVLQRTVLGTSTDLDGNFILQKIPVGQHDVRFTMMGYEALTRAGVQIQPGQTTDLIIKLDEIAIEAPELVVTASKRAQSISDSPTSISVLTAKDFEQKNLIYLDELLEHVSGVNFMGNQINIRGSSGFSHGAGSRVMFLVDGVPVMPGDSGDIKWDLIPASQIARVEIVKGAGSALYGSAALGGVINVITKEPALKSETNFRFSSGFYDNPRWSEWDWTDRLLHFDDVDVDHTRRLGKTNMFVSIGRHQSTGYQQNGHYLRYNAAGKVEIKLTPQSTLNVSSNWEGGKFGTGIMWRNQHQALEVTPTAIGDKTKSHKFSLNAFHRWAANKSFGLKSRVSYFRNYWNNLFHDNTDASMAQRFGLEIQGDYIVSKSHSLTFGTEETLDHVVSDLVGRHDIYVLSAYLQDEIRVWPNVSLTLGVRFDYHHTDTGIEDNEASPKLGMVWHITDKSTLRMSSGRGFRAPSMSERFPDMFISGLRVVPNVDLKPETAWSHEIGFNQKLGNHIILDIAGFSNDYWDLIEPEPDITQTVQFVNVTRARISGVETNLRFSLWKRHVSGELGYTYLDPTDLDTDETLAYRSKHMINGSLTFSYGIVELGGDYKYIERLDVVKVYPQDPRVPQKVFNGRLIIHLGRWTLAANANNIFNHMHTQIERTILPIRNYTATVSLKM
jgi:outer membrane receptor for ferrienterochelin and colicins